MAAEEGRGQSALAPWGKTDGPGGDFHHLAHHCADVAACFEAIVGQPVMRARLERTAGRALSQVDMARLAVLAFLHDAGKLHPGFQAKGWPEGAWRGRPRGHLAEGAAIFTEAETLAIGRNLCLADLEAWGVDQHLLFAAIAHHGGPFQTDSVATRGWGTSGGTMPGYDPLAASAGLGKMLRRWFPLAFTADEKGLPTLPAFQHLFCGLVSLADWLGSDRRIFPFRAALDPDYIVQARAQAGAAAARIGLDTEELRPAIAGRSDFATITGWPAPSEVQALVGAFPLDEQLVILESETGSGKTEAALWRFLRLFEAEQVDSLYFALPTRAAALQLHGRINAMLTRLFGAGAPPVVLAVPGYLRAGEAEGQRLPGWQVHWDDDGGADEERLLARWAAENTKRYLAAWVAVGTVDQAMLSALRVKHAHLRSAALARSLLVIDEVHASDSYMTEAQRHLLRLHRARGGYAMLMSATLGSVARAKWLSAADPPSFQEAVATPYPAVWGATDPTPQAPAGPPDRQKTVAMTAVPTMAADEAARIAIAAARRGARVMVVRNTVAAAIATWIAVQGGGGGDLLLRVRDGPALHHGRFAAEDRRLLDQAVESALNPKARQQGGCIVIGTQTLEQSLDIDADLLLTDLCPVDVLLQRIGRLHRHALSRPPGFENPACHVMMPPGGLAPLLAPGFENGLGAWIAEGGIQGIYLDLSVLELTRRLVAGLPRWTIPAMNRELVESATHPERIAALHAELGEDWARYRDRVTGRELAEGQAARGIVLLVHIPFADVQFPSDGEAIRTRLGAEGATITFTEPAQSPFGQRIDRLTLPAHWSRGIDTREPVTPEARDDGLRFSVGGRAFGYVRAGLIPS